MKRGNKLGQFYLISAIIIATSLASIFIVSNYIRKGPETNIINIDEEMKTESRYFLEYGLNKKLTEDNLHDKMKEEFVLAYTFYTKGDNDFYFIFATENKLTVAGYQNEAKTITLNGASITSTAGVFSGEITPPPTQANLSIDNTQLQFTINAQDTGRDFYSIVTDSTGLITGEDLEVSSGFIQSNNDPEITSTAVTSINEGGSYIYQVTATDADGDALTYSLTQKPTWLSMNSATGEITGTAPDVTVNTNYPVELSVSDGEGTDTQSYTLTVNFVLNNPVITSTPVTSVNEGNAYTYDVEATDADGDILTYSLTENPVWLSIDSATGLITGTAPDVTADINEPIRILVSDGTGRTDSQDYYLRIYWIEVCDDHYDFAVACKAFDNNYAEADICLGGASPTTTEKDDWCKNYFAHSDATATWGCNTYYEIGCSWCSSWYCPGATQGEADAWCSAKYGYNAVSYWNPICNEPKEIGCYWQTCI